MPREIGRIRFFFQKKKYGFIATADGAEFFISPIESGELPAQCEGMLVEFTAVLRGNRHQATDIIVVDRGVAGSMAPDSPLSVLKAGLSSSAKKPELDPYAVPALPPHPWSSSESAEKAPQARDPATFPVDSYGTITIHGTEYGFNRNTIAGLPLPNFGPDLLVDAVDDDQSARASVATPAPPLHIPAAQPGATGHPPTRRSAMGPMPPSFSGSRTRLGYVRFYYDKKSYGFILGSDGVEYFFQRSALEGDDTIGIEGAVVMFEAVRGRKGLQAITVRRAAAELQLDDRDNVVPVVNAHRLDASTK